MSTLTNDVFELACVNDTEECDSNPCLNGGTCVEDVVKYQCNCVAGYTGVHCETCKLG